MKLLKFALSLVLVVLLFACNRNANSTLVLIKTDLGDITIKLYDETPQHRDNFLKLANEGFFNGTLFHRVIENFMIQGGDPDSKNAEPGQQLGNGGPGYDIPAEFVPAIFHKKGVIAAARLSDQENPDRKSSGSQFYIVQGKIFTEAGLDSVEMKVNMRKREQIKRSLMLEHRAKLLELQEAQKMEEINNLFITIEEETEKQFAENETFALTPEQRELYTTTGGTPHLDGAYTVFGEVMEGLEVIDKIAAVKTDEYDRPLHNIKMKVKVIKR